MKRWLVWTVVISFAMLLATACTSTKENPPVTSPSGGQEATLAQVHAMQAEVRRYGTELIAALGGGTPNPGTVRIGPVPCQDAGSEIAKDGSFYVSGGWQIPLASDLQVSALRAIRDSWQARGYKVIVYQEVDGGRSRLEGEDPKTGHSFSVISTNPPTAVAVRVLTPCAKPADGVFPGEGATVYE